MNIYRALLAPVLFEFDAELTHKLAILALKMRGGLGRPPVSDAALNIKLWDLDFPNPVGMAAGFDKNATVPDALLALGFGFVEVGTITPRPQSGNPKPRVFRLTEDEAVINRLGFNGDGLTVAQGRLQRRRRSGIVGANVGKNRDTTDEIDDYVKGVSALAPHVDYLTVNISSPNTPGLRDLQRRERLSELLSAVVNARDAVAGRRTPVLVKIAPDLNESEIRDIAEVSLATRVDGLIATNTSLERPETLRSVHKGETGGLSGHPVFGLSTKILAELYRATEGKIPLIGVGGIASGADAYQKIKVGASLVQLYSSLVFKGPALIAEIQRDLLLRLKADGFRSIKEAVGTAHR